MYTEFTFLITLLYIATLLNKKLKTLDSTNEILQSAISFISHKKSPMSIIQFSQHSIRITMVQILKIIFVDISKTVEYKKPHEKNIEALAPFVNFYI